MPFEATIQHHLHVQTLAANAQVAAIPIRWTSGRPEVLLITTRRRRHWTVPKGWPLVDSLAHECAAREAYEEAGVCGRVEPFSLGDFQYWKKSKDGRLFLRVTVFALHVDSVLSAWPERDQRKRAWFSPDVAGKLTGNDDLSALIRCAVAVKFTPAKSGPLN